MRDSSADSSTFRCLPTDLDEIYVKSLAYVTCNVNGSLPYLQTWTLTVFMNIPMMAASCVSGGWMCVIGHWTISLVLKLGLFTIFHFKNKIIWIPFICENMPSSNFSFVRNRILKVELQGQRLMYTPYKITLQKCIHLCMYALHQPWCNCHI